MVPFWVNSVPVLPKNDRGLSLERILERKEGWNHVVLSNYMFDIEWIVKSAPSLKNSHSLTILSGEKDADALVASLRATKLESKTTVLSPKLPLGFGTHHSKFIICFADCGARVAITTANFICDDWERKTQGIYVQDFPVRREGMKSKGDFSEVLCDYLERCGALHVLPMMQLIDFSSAIVDLVVSVPGFHNGPDLERFGQGRLRKLLQALPRSSSTRMSWQFTSQGSLTDSFLRDMQSTLMGGDKHEAQVEIHMPTEEQVRTSVEGWRGGFSIPVFVKNCHAFVNSRLFRWGGLGENPRNRVMPHIKSYSRFDRHAQKLDWFLLTSSNLSRAAFGEFQKGHAQLAIRSYEVGVLYHPTRLESVGQADLRFSCTPQDPIVPMRSTSCIKHMFSNQVHSIWLPYSIFQAVPYESTTQLKSGASSISRKDIPWVMDIPHRGVDSLGCTFESLVGYSHYGPTSWLAPTLHFESWRPEIVQIEE